MDERKKRYAQELSQMIRCETVSVMGQTDYTKYTKFQELLKTLFPAIFGACKVEIFHGSILMHWAGEHPEKTPVLFMNHQDVVPASGEWEHAPFSGDITDDKIWGRGTLDDKGGLWAMLRAADELAAEGFVPDCDIWFESACAEEINGNHGEGADEISQILEERGIRFAFVLDEGGMIVTEPLPGAKGSYAMIGVGEKGTADLRFVAKGRGGHASTPPKDTPLVRLGKFMAECDENKIFTVEMNPAVAEMFRRGSAAGMDGMMKRVLGKPDVYKLLLEGVMNRTSPEGAAMLRTTLAFTMAQGSEGHNVLPQEAWVLGNMRFSHHQGFEDSLPEVSRYVASAVLHNNQSPYTIVLVVPEKEALADYAKSQGLDPASREGREAMLKKIQSEIDSYKKGGAHEGLFPERWLPAAVVICDEPFTIANRMLNSTMKMVRGKVEEHYADRIAYAYTPEGKQLLNERNLASLS